MRVTEVTSGLGLGGAEIALARRLRKVPSGVETMVVSTRPDLSELNDSVSAFAELKVLAPGRLDARPILDAIEAFHPDVVLIHNPLEVIRIFAGRTGVRGVPAVGVAHSDRVTFHSYAEKPLALALWRQNRKLAGHIAVSGRAAQGLQCRGSRRVEVVHLGSKVDLHAEPMDAWPPGSRLRWIAVGRFVEPKNLIGLVRAVATVQSQLRRAGAHLRLVGYGPLEEPIEQAIRVAGLDDLVSVLPKVLDASALLLCADALVLSSTNEGGPLTVYEALLAGCLIAATPVGVVPEVLAEDSGSVIAENSTDEAIASALLALVSRGPLDAAIRQKRQLASRRWDADACSDAFYRVVHSFIEH